MKIKNICLIADGYPSEDRVVNAFVENLVNEFIDQGINCVVIAPQSLTKALIRMHKLLPSKRSRKTTQGNEVTIFSPKYFSFTCRKILNINLAKLTLRHFRKAAEKVFKKIQKEIKFDVVYGHFIFESGIVANYLGQKYQIPSFFAYGENTTYTIDYLGSHETKKLLEGVKGAVSVSTENKNVLLKNDIVSEAKVSVFPNAINSAIFFQKDKLQLRKKYGIDQNIFIVAFVGRFLPVKGPDRLASAIAKIDHQDVYSFFIGTGPVEPNCSNILFKGSLEHSLISDYLSMADVFVLPTLAEGCCNAIIEAMACGLPIVSSNLSFNDDILDSSNSIRIDSLDIDKISAAIDTLYNDVNLRLELSAGALKTAEKLNITNRAKNIIQYMEERISDND